MSLSGIQYYWPVYETEGVAVSGMLLYRRDKLVSSPSLHQVSNVDNYCSRNWSCRDKLLFSIDYLLVINYKNVLYNFFKRQGNGNQN